MDGATSDPVDPAWCIVRTRSKGEAEQHLLARRFVLDTLSRERGAELLEWTSKSGFTAAMTAGLRQVLLKDAGFPAKVSRYRNTGLIEPWLLDIVRAALSNGVEDNVIERVQPFVASTRLHRWWTLAIVDHLIFFAFEAVTGIRRRNRLESLCWVSSTGERTPVAVDLADPDGEYAIGGEVESHPRPQDLSTDQQVDGEPDRGRGARGSTVGILQRRAGWYFTWAVDRQTIKQIAREAFVSEAGDRRKDIRDGVNRIRDLLSLSGHPEDGSLEPGETGMFIIEQELLLEVPYEERSYRAVGPRPTEFPYR